MKAGPIQRYRRLSSEQRRLLSRSVILLTAASAAVALLPFRRALAIGSVAIGKHGDAVDPFDCVWAVEAAARRLPWRTMCIEKGLAVQRMLRLSGVDARLHYGARHHPVTKSSRRMCGSPSMAEQSSAAKRPKILPSLQRIRSFIVADSFDYEVFGLTVRSEIELPELFPSADVGPPDVVIRNESPQVTSQTGMPSI